MVVACHACGASNDDQARFCDQCGAALAGALTEVEAPPARPAAVPASAPPARSASGINWAGLVALAAALAVLWWLFGRVERPASPVAGETPPGDAQGMQMFEQAQAELKKNKDALVKDPTDTAALSGLYGLYAQIGQTEKVRPYLDGALAELRRRRAAEAISVDDAIKKALDLAMAAMTGDDALGAVAGLEYYYELNPKRVSTAAMIANIYYDIGMPAEGIAWYDRYLEAADPLVEADTIRGAKVDRESLRLALAAQNADKGLLAAAVGNLQQLTQQYPVFWAAQFNLGQAYLQQGDTAKALEAWHKCAQLAGTPEEKWRTDAALAEAQGQPAPAPPAGLAVPGSSTDPALNPHAESAKPPPAGENPHVSANPHGG